MTSPDSEKPSLLVHEWVAVALIIGFILMLTIISRPSPYSDLQVSRTAQPIISNQLTVTIDGAVAHPGKYTLNKGSTLQDLFAEAIPLPTADLKVFKTSRKLREGQNIYVPREELVTVYLQGAVKQPGAHQFPKSTRWIDLKDKDLFATNADLKSLEKKRKLKAEEVISIPAIPE